MKFGILQAALCLRQQDFFLQVIHELCSGVDLLNHSRYLQGVATMVCTVQLEFVDYVSLLLQCLQIPLRSGVVPLVGLGEWNTVMDAHMEHSIKERVTDEMPVLPHRYRSESPDAGRGE